MTEDQLNLEFAKLQVSIEQFNGLLRRVDETVNGTIKTGGLKERIAVAETEIEKNKESWEKVQIAINNLGRDLATSITGIKDTLEKEKDEQNKKIETLMTFYRPAIWLLGIVVAAIAGALISGKIGIIFR